MISPFVRRAAVPEDYQPIRNRGIFNNRWIMRLMSPLRFAYEANPAIDKRAMMP